MPSGTLQVYTALAENAAPLPGVTVLVLNEAGTQIARLTTNDVGSAPELMLTAPDEAYSLDEANTTVRPYALPMSHPARYTPPGRSRRCGPTFWRRSAWR